MTRIVHYTLSQTLTDLRYGRESWRVLLMLSLPAFVAGLAVGILQLR